MMNTTGPPDAKIMIVSDFPTKNEAMMNKPFSDATFSQVISQSGMNRFECLLTYACREYPPGNKVDYFFHTSTCTSPKPKAAAWKEQLLAEIELYKPNIIIAMGKASLWMLTGEHRLNQYRGYVISGTNPSSTKIVSTYHVTSITEQWKLLNIAILDFRKAFYNSGSKGLPEDPRTLISDPTVSQFVDYCDDLCTDPKKERVALDIENSQPGSHITRIGLGHSRNFAMSMKVGNGKVPSLNENDEVKVWQALGRVIETKKLIMQNCSHDIGVMWYNNNLICKNIIMDTFIGAHVCWPEFPRSLLFLGSICLNVPPWKGHAKESEGLYNAGDVANTFGVAEVLEKEIDKQGVRHTFDFEMSQIPVAIMLQLQGIRIDKNKQKALIEECKNIAKETKVHLEKIAGREVNFNSPKQLQQLLYFDLGLPIQYKRRKRATDPRTPTADAKALERLSRLVPDNPLFQLVIQHKRALKLVGSFLDIELSPEGKTHTTYNITGVSTPDKDIADEGKKSFGRWSSSKSIILPYGSGNLQNIPKRARKMYVAENGKNIIQADYVQAEAVKVAHYIQDHKLIQMFKDSYGLPANERAKYDIHKITASMVFNIPIEEVTDDQRVVGKMLRHATNYSAGPTVLADGLKCSFAEAKKFLSIFANMCPQLTIWHKGIQEELRSGKTLTNAFGRKHKFLERWGDKLFRSAYAYKPQSSVGDMLNMAITDFYHKHGEKYDIILQLHDAFYVSCYPEENEIVAKLMYESMKIPVTINFETFYVDVDYKLGESWGEMADWEPEFVKGVTVNGKQSIN